MWVYLDHEGRIVTYNANYSMEGNSGWVFFDGTLPQNYSDYLLVDGELVYDPMPEPVMPEPEPEGTDIAEQVLDILKGARE